RLARAEDLRVRFRELMAAAAPAGDPADFFLTALVQQAALLESLAAACVRPGPDQALLWLCSPRDPGQPWLELLAKTYTAAFGEALHLDSPREHMPAGIREEVVVIRGPHVLALAAAEAGTHLLYPAHQPLLPIQVTLLPLAADAAPDTILAAERQ